MISRIVGYSCDIMVCRWKMGCCSIRPWELIFTWFTEPLGPIRFVPAVIYSQASIVNEVYILHPISVKNCQNQIPWNSNFNIFSKIHGVDILDNLEPRRFYGILLVFFSVCKTWRFYNSSWISLLINKNVIQIIDIFLF